MIGQQFWKKAVLHFALLIGVVLSMFPFYWLTVMAGFMPDHLFGFIFWKGYRG